jgi:hypothetical protein
MDQYFALRVRDLAVQLGLSVKEVLLMTYELNIYAKTGFSPLENGQIERIKSLAKQRETARPVMGESMRLAALARELQTTSKKIVDIALQLNINVRNGFSLVKQGQAERIRIKHKHSQKAEPAYSASVIP